MAQQSRSTLKGYFQSGDRPTETQFEDLIDSAANLSEDNLITTSNNATTSQSGIVTRSSSSEITTGTQDSKYVTPKGAKLAASTHAPVKSVNGQTGHVNIGNTTDWLGVDFQTGFLPYGGAWQEPRYRMKNGVVYLEGLCKGSNVQGLICMLEPGFWPENQLLFPAITHNNTMARIDIFPSGEVFARTYSATWISLSGISFVVD